MEITLSIAEQKLAEYLAKKRYQNARKGNIKNSKIGSQSDYETDLAGIASEIAFCKAMNIYPDLNLDHRPPEDCTLSTGQTVDCKATKYRKGRLLAVPWKKPKVDLFALIVGEFPTYEIVGYATSEELLKKKNIINLGHGEGYALEQKDLKRF